MVKNSNNRRQTNDSQQKRDTARRNNFTIIGEYLFARSYRQMDYSGNKTFIKRRYFYSPLRRCDVLSDSRSNFIIGLEYQSDAERLYAVLPKRLSKYGLELSLEKSRLQNFVPENTERNNTIDFLGFTPYWTKSRAGNYIIKRKTRNKSKIRIINELYQMIKKNRHLKLIEQKKAINRKLQGVYVYFAIRGNYYFLHLLYEKARYFWYKMLNHRGGRKKSYSSNGFIELIRIFALLKPIKLKDV